MIKDSVPGDHVLLDQPLLASGRMSKLTHGVPNLKGLPDENFDGGWHLLSLF